ncbi:MAG: hypothetical protein P8013_04055 [Candidatus Sulfobium sp.]|jgi:hypothetical protein
MSDRTSARWLNIFLLFTVLSTAMVVSGCGGGKPEAVWNVAGSWYVYHDAAGTPGEQGPDLFTFTQSDNDLSGTTGEGEIFTGSVSGTDVSFSWTGSDGTSYTYNGTASNGNMTGTWSSNTGQSGTWHAIINLDPIVTDLGGNWNIYTTTDSTEQGPDVFALMQSGNSISGTAKEGEPLKGSIGNRYILFSWTDSSGTTYVYIGTVTGSSDMSGTWTTPGGQSGTWRATKIG